MDNLFFVTTFFFACTSANAPEIYETDMNFRVDAGTRTCFFETAKPGQIMELYYQVIDGKHGELDISVDVFAPDGTQLVSDYKKSENSIIMEVEQEGDYTLCLDNTFSMMNSKLVFVYIVIEERKKDGEAEVSVINEEGEEEILDFIGMDEAGNTYTMQVKDVIRSLTRTLNYVVKARHTLDVIGARKARDSYTVLEDTFIVDIWSGLQITFMLCVGMLQVYMIKKLFDKPCVAQKQNC